MQNFFIVVSACFLISICVFLALILLSLKNEVLKGLTLFLVSFSAGTLIGGAFLHLLPEAGEKIDHETIFLISLFSFVVFFFLEKVLSWRHCHKENCDVHTFGHMNLIGDSIHNFLDGVTLAFSFLSDIKLGIITTFLIAAHEIPQEIGDFGVLLHANFSKKKALLWNFLVSLAVVIGGIAGFLFSGAIGDKISYVLPFSAGGFIYIAASDLIPEIRKEKSLKKSAGNFLAFLSGIAFMYFAKFFSLLEYK